MPIEAAVLHPLLRLSLVPGIGPQRLATLIRHFGCAERALGASARELGALPGMGAQVAHGVVSFAGRAGDLPTQRALESLERAGAVVLGPDDAGYPESFRVLGEPPFLVYAVGNLDLLQEPGVAFVGTREPTPYGRAAAVALAQGLARAGYVVVSGMARGIDTEAHSGALRVAGATIGVLGHGIDSVYPPENRALFRQVASQGLLITEMPPGEGPKAGNFPRRNRLIAALSRAVVVVEMGLKSGAQHTVTYALEQGKDVMAVPGPIGCTTSAGTNQLIREGARIVTSVEDVLEELEGVGLQLPKPLPAAPTLPLLGGNEDRVVRALSTSGKHVDALSAETEMRTGPLLALLLDLELRGFVESLPGKHFRRA